MSTARIAPPEGGLSVFDHDPELWGTFNRFYGYLWTDARKYIRENPGTSIAISLGAGLLLGFLLRGDDD